MHLKEPGFTCSACGPFTKHPKRILKFRETGSLKQLYRSELDKVCFAHDAVYSYSTGLAKRIISNKVLQDGADEIAINRNYDGYQRALTSMVYKFFDKKAGLGISVNEKPAKELHKTAF